MTTSIVFRFPAGRYHATPWGHHVNEGLVEWPPSPWRVLRALISTAFTKGMAPDPVPEGHPLIRLVEALSAEAPFYVIPRSSPATHTRHYMPLGTLDKGRLRTSLVLDTSAVLGNEELCISWPVELDSDCLELLQRMAPSISYLGRAESWVDARLLRTDQSLPNGEVLLPCTGKEVAKPGWEQVSLLAPTSQHEYGQWRDKVVAEVLEGIPLPEEGKKPPRKLLEAREKACEAYPHNLFDCLTRSTTWLQEYGWHQPPGSRRVHYSRPTAALATARPGIWRRTTAAKPVEAILLALASDTRNHEVLPLYSRCLPQAELLHRSLVSRAGRGEKVCCPVLTGKDEAGKPLQAHRHLHILPLSLDEPGRLDHFLLWAPMGIDRSAQEAIFSLRRTWTKGEDSALFLSVAGSGSLADFRQLMATANAEQRLLGDARIWTSVTPFVPPRHIKKTRHSLEEQVRAELESRDLPSDAVVTVLDREEWAQRRFHRFVRTRRPSAPQPPQDVGLALTVTFSEPVAGPLCLGYASHFGLGLFSGVD